MTAAPPSANVMSSASPAREARARGAHVAARVAHDAVAAREHLRGVEVRERIARPHVPRAREAPLQRRRGAREARSRARAATSGSARRMRAAPGARRSRVALDALGRREQPARGDGPGAARGSRAMRRRSRRRRRASSRDALAASASRSGLAAAAAAVGVGARRSATKSAMVKSVSWPTPLTTGMARGGDRARHDLLVEGPQVLEASAAAADDEHVDLGARVGRARSRARSAPPRASPCTCAG